MAELVYTITVGVGGAIEISNKVQAIAGFTLLEPWSLIGFAWQV